MNIAQIKIGTRHRRDMGDLDGLAASINIVGLLHPVVVDAAGNLIAGARRLEACRKLGWIDVPTTTAQTLTEVHASLIAERDENLHRKDFTVTEAVSMARALEPFERAAAKQRRALGNSKGGKKHNGRQVASETAATGSVATAEVEADSAPTSLSDRVANAETNEKLAEIIGFGKTKLQKARAVVEAAEKHPDAYGDLPEKMDRTGKVEPVYKTLVSRQLCEGLPRTGMPLPHPRAEAEHRWCKAMHDHHVSINSIKDYIGGIDVLVDGWRPEYRQSLHDEIKRMIVALQEFVSVLEARHGCH